MTLKTNSISGCLIVGVVICVGAGCVHQDTEMGAVQRGDEAFAQANYEEALAEYRLAIRQGADNPYVTLVWPIHTPGWAGR